MRNKCLIALFLLAAFAACECFAGSEEILLVWTDYYSFDPKLSKRGGRLRKLRKIHPEICKKPYAAKCRFKNDSREFVSPTDIVPGVTCNTKGLSCGKKADCSKYEITFQCQAGVNECKQKIAKCDPNAKCVDLADGYKCVCKKNYVKIGDKCVESGICRASGDPHYLSFDEYKYNFMGPCKYVFVKVCSTSTDHTIVPFTVAVINEYRKKNTRVSFTKEVEVYLGSTIINLQKLGVIKVNGDVINTPLSLRIGSINATFTRLTDLTKLETDFGLIVEFDGVSKAFVKITKSFATHLCGLCGNYDGNKQNEWIMPNGEMAKNITQFAESWRLASDSTSCLTRPDISEPPASVCNHQERKAAEAKCELLRNNTEFSRCHATVSPGSYYKDCVEDTCNDVDGSLFCASIKAYAVACANEDIFLRWRTASNCTPECGANMHYEDQTPGCVNSCEKPDAESECTEPDTDGCVCDDNFLLSDDKCVPEEECGCQVGSAYFPFNATWMINNCTTTRKCFGPDDVKTIETTKCHGNGLCKNTAANREMCQCKEGYEGNGYSCSDFDECKYNAHRCSPYATCENTEGGYKCECKDGFTGDGKKCVDVNECDKGTFKCGANAFCFNTLGSYNCSCLPGFRGNGAICERFFNLTGNQNETQYKNCSYFKSVACNDISWCENTADGGYKCHCPGGSHGNGKKIGYGGDGNGCTMPECPEGWFPFELFCYRLSDGNSTGTDMEPCKSIGGFGATITDPQTMTFLSTHMPVGVTSVWMGYQFMPGRGGYFPFDLSMTNSWKSLWFPGEPVVDVRKQCTAFQRVNPNDKLSQLSKLKTKACSDKLRHMCKRPRIHRDMCPDGWKYYDKKCYATFDLPKTFDESVINCAKYDADPVQITSRQMKEFFLRNYLQYTSHNTWIGLRKGQDENLTWFDESADTFPGVMSDYGDVNATCVSLFPNGTRVLTECSKKLQYICEKISDVPYRCPITMDDVTAYFKDKCYTPTKKKKPRDEGETDCRDAGRELLSITSPLEQLFLENHLVVLEAMNKSFPSAWMGLIRVEGDLTWNRGNVSVNYTKWMDGQPNNKDCGYIKKVGMELPWAMSRCNAKRVSFCEYDHEPCTKNSDCHEHAWCHLNLCSCKSGYHGTGKHCEDIDECNNTKPACTGENEVCENTIGSHKCNCAPDHIRDEFDVCKHIRYCEGDSDCANNGTTSKCIKNLCECRAGYRGDGKEECVDIDECEEDIDNCDANATCTNTPGSYTCECTSGYRGDGRKCERIPGNCEEIRLKDPSSGSGFYEIDPDFSGEALPMMVECDMRPEIGITIFHHSAETFLAVVQMPTPDVRTITYDNPIDDIKIVVNASAYCYQYIQYKCVGSRLLGKGYYMGYDNNVYKMWGGSDVEGQCLCGSLKVCVNSSEACNCDGDGDDEKIDEGRIYFREQLPVRTIAAGGENDASRFGATRLWALKCGPRPFDIYKNCQEIKDELGEEHNGPQIIDVDGNDNPLDAFFVYCDMESFEHVAITVIPQKVYPGRDPPNPNRAPKPLQPGEPLQPGNNTIEYMATPEQIAGLIDISPFCVQEVNYTCTNSRILNGYGHLVGQRYGPLSFWAGGKDNNCACGTLNYCEDKSAHCNCDIKDGKTRMDFGFITNKTYLPISDVVLNDIGGPGQSAILAIGNLECANFQFGIEPACQEYAERGYHDSYTYLIDPDGPKLESTETDNVDPFLVHCIMDTEPDIGYTVVPVEPPSEGRSPTTISPPGTGPTGSGPPGTGPSGTGPPGTGPPTTGPPGVGPPGTGGGPTTTGLPIGGGSTSTTPVTEKSSSTTPPPSPEDLPLVEIPPDCSTANCSYKPRYPTANKPQLEKLTDRSYACYQRLKISCNNLATITIGTSSWNGQNLEPHHYFSGGNDSKPYCHCHSSNACPSGCFCAKQNVSVGVDDGFLKNKNHLPLYELFLNPGATSGNGNMVEIGDLVCSEIFPDCHGYETGYVPTVERGRRTDYGPYTIDPDGQMGEDPFEVNCKFPRTIVTIPKKSPELDPKDPNFIGVEKNCTQLEYFKGATYPQLKGLTRYSNYCIQYAQYVCHNSPITGYVSLFDNDDNKMAGWANDYGLNECPCGVLNKCKGGPQMSCNCDSRGKGLDHGIIINRKILPLTKVCAGFPEKGPSNRKGRWLVSDLECGPKPFDLFPDCQKLASSITKYRFFKSLSNKFVDHVWTIDPDLLGPIPPLLVLCEITKTPRVGVTVIPPRHPKCVSGLDNVSHRYSYHATAAQLRALKRRSTYAEQAVTYECQNAPFTGNFQPYAAKRTPLTHWTSSTKGATCLGGQCQCGIEDGIQRVENGNFLDMDDLPIRVVTMQNITNSNASRILCLQDLKLYKIYRTCDHILRLARPKKNGIYPIDPDQAGGLPFFGVHCIFRKIGISQALLKKPDTVKGNDNNPLIHPVIYRTSTPDQLQGLAKISQFCYQDVWFFCTKSKLLGNPNTYLSSYAGQKLDYWGGADAYNATGCGCGIVGTCTRGECTCNSAPNQTEKEGGRFTKRSIFPISRINIAISNPQTKVTIKAMRCGPMPFDMPRDCNSAAKVYKYTTDFVALIQLANFARPVLVSCIFMRRHGKSFIPVMHLKPKFSQDPSSPTTTNVEYYGVTPEETDSLIKYNRYCVQMMKSTCRNTKMSDRWSFTNFQNTRTYFGAARTPGQCTCGAQEKCSTLKNDTIAEIKARPCNCDIADDVTRYDAGAITDKWELPVTSYNLNPGNGSLSVKLSGIFCSHTPFDIDECKTEYHDCDVNAECRDKPKGYDCICKVGWQGLYSKQAYATGRTCVDNDECTVNPCMPHSTCKNTPGSYECYCVTGYRKSADGKLCVDIDECKEKTDDCDTHATCYNTQGSYKCICNKGYQGGGRQGDCEKVGLCHCWGDPHCMSFDSRLSNYQGACQYTMVRDNCANGIPVGPATFEVIQKNWRRNVVRKVSWVKEVIVKIDKLIIELRSNYVVVLNGQRIYLPYPFGENKESVNFEITYVGSNVVLTSKLGFIVSWNGVGIVRVNVLSKYQTKVCGLCGNFNNNPHDDWIVGEKCDHKGEVTNNRNLFGDSWRVDVPKDKDPKCEPNCRYEPPIEKCNAVERLKATEKCKRLKTIFAKCADVLDLNVYVETCSFDICESGLVGETLCSVASSIARECFDDHHITVDWRNENFCAMKCGKNQEYKVSASPCQPSCADLTNSQPCDKKPAEMCVCKKGYLLMEGKCILPKECGCIMDSTYYPVGTIIVSSDCTQECSCKVALGNMDCKNKTCVEYATCTFKDDEKDCYCDAGFTGIGDETCDDIDECSKTPFPCDVNANCTNTIGNYTCSCKHGYQGDGFKCDNINECLEPDICENVTEECHDLPGSYECRCAAGFMKNVTSGKCEDKNECKLGTDACDRVSTVCNNTFGGYVCDCEKGFMRVNDYKCIDIDECTPDDPPCDSNATCTNTVGGYSCDCNKGYYGNGTNCNDIDECQNKPCYRDARCENLPGTFKCYCTTGQPGCIGPDPCLTLKCGGNNEICKDGICQCKTGFERNEKGECVNIDECEKREDDCRRENKTCVDTFGSHYCQCMKGFIKVGDKCEDEDECKRGTYQCNENAVCENTIGGYQCICRMGFTGSCDECRDIDECFLGYCNGPHHVCTNVEGSYTCECLDGYQKNQLSTEDDVECIDTDECVHGIANCLFPMMKCVNVPGSYVCVCPGGYTKTANGSCEDNNECLDIVNECHAKAKCKNLIGSYECECLPGYHGDGRKCSEDPDIHLQCGDKKCHVRAHCQATNVCVCNKGYSGDGLNCTDIDECLLAEPICDRNAYCINLPGSVECTCKETFEGNGFICNEHGDTDLCRLERFCINGECLNSTCYCNPGYRLKGTMCENINECREKQPCPKSVCVDTLGSYKCVCSAGMTEKSSIGNVLECEDVDECLTDVCGDVKICVNSPGSYKCRCPDGYKDLFNDGSYCSRPNDPQCSIKCPEFARCEKNKCLCPPGFIMLSKYGVPFCKKEPNLCETFVNCTGANVICSEGVGLPTCHCEPGFRLTAANKCENIDECAEGTAQCAVNAGQICVDTVGSYKCICTPGKIVEGRKCVDERPCNCGAYGVCRSSSEATTLNQCHCHEGFEEVDNVCVNINECIQDNPCHQNADCTDNIGSYSCKCKTNFKGDGKMVCDNNECETVICPLNAVCVNKISGFECVCKSGYARDYKMDCIDEKKSHFAQRKCQENAILTQLRDDEYECQCLPGFQHRTSTEDVNIHFCDDINECYKSNDCDANAVCTNYPGSYACACGKGYTGTGRFCEDINECNLHPPVCVENAECTNTIGSFTCSCKKGYRGDGRYQCFLDRNCDRYDGCHPNATCSFRNRRYGCICNKGFQGDGTYCEDANECLIATACGENAECTNLVGSYSCACKEGFQGYPYSKCFDVDECADPTKNNCSRKLEECVNTMGTFSCNCSSGATLEDGICKDIDECSSSGTAICPTDSVCNNTVGGYKCNCQPGLYMKGRQCVDIDECKLGIANCTVNTFCVNRKFSFECVCQSGYKLENDNCTDIDECNDEDSSNLCDENAECTNKEPGYECTCKEGYVGNGFSCMIKNPCSEKDACVSNATCSNPEEGKKLCKCDIGFRIVGFECEPYDECYLKTDNCNSSTEICVPKEVGYKCVCKEGYKKEGKKCVDKNECDPTLPEYQGGKCSSSGGKCVNVPGTYACTCPPSMINDGDKCKNKKDCKENPNLCTGGAVCKDTISGHQCLCKLGFERIDDECVDIDECATGQDNCIEDSFCVNLNGTYTCKCDKGKTYNVAENICNDTNECEEIAYPCGTNGVCNNIPENYTCTCIEGYQWNATRQECEDINECETPSNPCHDFAECSNIPGSCKCHCKAGYVGDGRYCEEEGNCTAQLRSMCANSSVCFTTSADMPTCKCRFGYAAVPNATKYCNNGSDSTCKMCHDIDECITKTAKCHWSAKCKNSDGYYQCTCPQHLRGNGRECEDINECATGDHQCDTESTVCVNLDNTNSSNRRYQCDCKEGYSRKSWKKCLNINECKNNNTKCPPNSHCKDGIGNYHCECNQGYKKLNKTCVDINECNAPENVCDIDISVCQNVPGGYICKCNKGYFNPRNNLAVCLDINECERPKICAKNATCTNYPGSYQCSCNEGFQLKKGLCVDVNECVLAIDDCDTTAKCKNTAGSFTCLCRDGFKMAANGVCVDIDECLADLTLCGDQGICNNKEGSYECACKKGFRVTENKRSCVDINECINPAHHCPEQSWCFNNYGSYQCYCNFGFKKINGSCIDINECKDNPKLCAPGICTNTLGGYNCQCPTGYSLTSDNECIEIDECLFPLTDPRSHNCLDNQLCFNTEGSFKCLCKQGYKLKDGRCEDINECNAPNVCLRGQCSNSIGSFECSCPKGFTKVDGICDDVNECEMTPDICGVEGADCINTFGSYKCICQPGFTQTGGVSETCTPIDYCQNITCGRRAQCEPLSPGFECKCMRGYKLNERGLCVNIDECQTELTPCPLHSECVDTIGSYRCPCRKGYRQTGGPSGPVCTAVCQYNTCPTPLSCVVQDDSTHRCECQCFDDWCDFATPMCGTNGVTYSSSEELLKAVCAEAQSSPSEQRLSLNYPDTCQTTCDSVTCPKPMTCMMGPAVNTLKQIPICKCQECSDEDRNSGPVCIKGDRPLEFLSRCQVIKENCLRTTPHEIAYVGHCKRPINCKWSDWSSWSGCSVSCGVGRKQRTRVITRMARYNGACNGAPAEEEECSNGPCPGTDLKIDCPPYSWQLGDKCVCPSCLSSEKKPFCGEIQGKTKSYGNMCEMKLDACKQNASITAFHEGACGEYVPQNPVNCTVVIQFRELTIDNCKSSTPVAVNKCLGGCGRDEKLCCNPSKMDNLLVEFECPDNSVVLKRIQAVRECECSADSLHHSKSMLTTISPTDL